MLLHSGPASAQPGVWSRLTPPHVSESFPVFDPVRDRFLLLPFGQYSPAGEQWVLELDHPDAWHKISDGGSSPPFALVRATVYDPAFDRLLVLARDPHVPFPNTARLTVWALSLAGPDQWHELAAPADVPADRHQFSIVFDTRRGSFVLFGGSDSDFSIPGWNDVWRLAVSRTDAAWERLAPGGDSLSARANAGAIYDAKRDRVVAFGGSKAYPGGGGSESNDVLALDLSPTPRWHVLEGDINDGTFTFALAAVYDSLADRMIVFPRTSRLHQALALALSDLSTWSPYDTMGTAGPSLLGYYSAQDPARGRAIVLGTDRAIFAVPLAPSAAIHQLDSKQLRLQADRFFSGYQAPVPAFVDEADGSVLVWGGFLSLDPAASRVVWRFRADDSPGWTRIELAGEVPTGRTEAMAALDFRRDRWLVYGGETREPEQAVRLLGDLWSFDPRTLRWTCLDAGIVGSGPGPRIAGEAAYDAIGDRLIVHGGLSEPSFSRRTDSWSHALGEPAEWQEIRTVGRVPSNRAEATAIWDPANNQFILHGGTRRATTGGIGSARNMLWDTWRLPLDGTATWDSLVVAPRDAYATELHFAHLDVARGSMGVIGGYSQRVEPVEQGTTALRLLSLGNSPGWSVPDEGGAQLPPGTRTSVFDSRRDRLFVFRGIDLEQAWVLVRAQPTILAPLDLTPTDADNVVPAHGVLEVALLGTPSFDAASVDPASASLAGAPARAAKRADRAAVRDVNRDGWADRLLMFDAARIQAPPEARVLRLDARTRAGVAVVAYDLARISGMDHTPVALSGDPDGPIDQVWPLDISCASPTRSGAHVRMSLPHGGRVVLEVYSVSGRRVFRQDLGQLDAGVHELPAMPTVHWATGVYWLRGWLDSESVRGKVVVLP